MPAEISGTLVMPEGFSSTRRGTIDAVRGSVVYARFPPLPLLNNRLLAGGDGHVYAPRSRFLADEDLDAFEVVGSALSPALTTATPVAQTALRVDLKATMRAMWR
jgi:hypothetical protein